ncbi:MAG: DUF819 family protein [Salinivirgaceae bacterium]
MINSIVVICFYLLVPVVLIMASDRFVWINKIGAVIFAYALGFLAGNLGLLKDIPNLPKIQDTINSVSIPLALPLLLFTLDIRSWLKVSGKAVVALVVLVFCVIVAVASGYFLFKNEIPEAWKISGMLLGVYTGGTPNLASIHSMLNSDPNVFLTVNTIDMMVSSVYLLFLMTLGKLFFRWFLPNKALVNPEIIEITYEDETHYKGMFKKNNFLPLLKAVMFSVLVGAISIGVSFLIVGQLSMLVLILSITSGSIGLSLVKSINTIKYAYQAGMYFIIVFCLVVASMANIQDLGHLAGGIFKYITFVVFGSLVLKTLLSKLFKIDADTLIVASTALICSPPFVPMMAGALKNKQVMVTGITIGIIGYAIGNYLGVTIAYVLNGM